jgi:hypothetical protein
MSPHTCITFLLKPTKRYKKKKEGVLSKWDNKVDEWHMKTKCPKQHVNFPRKKDHWYTPHFNIKFHRKYGWQSPKNPLAHPKCVSHSNQSATLRNFYA